MADPISPERQLELYKFLVSRIGAPGYPGQYSPHELPNNIVPRFGALSQSKFLQSLMNSFAGMHWKSTQIFIERITILGDWMREIFPIKTWPQALLMYNGQLKETQTGQMVELYSEWTMPSIVYPDTTRGGGGPAIFEATRRVAETRSFRYKGGGFRVSLDFAFDDTQLAMAFRKTEWMSENVYKTLEYELIGTVVDEAIREYASHNMRSFPSSITNIQSFVDSMRFNMFVFHKRNGDKEFEASVMEYCSRKGIVPNTLITSQHTLRHLALTKPENTSFVDIGAKAADDGRIVTQLDPAGRGRTPLHNWKVVASAPFVMGEDRGRVDDPTRLLCTFGLFYGMNHTTEHNALTRYDHDDRNIRITNLADKQWQTLSFREAFAHASIFDPEGGLDDHGRVALMILSGVMKPLQRDTLDQLLLPSATGQPVNYAGLAGRRRVALPNVNDQECRKWKTCWRPEVEHAVNQGEGVGRYQSADDNDVDPDWTPSACHAVDGLPNIVNLYTLYATHVTGWLERFICAVRKLPPTQLDRWDKIVDGQSKPRASVRGGVGGVRQGRFRGSGASGYKKPSGLPSERAALPGGSVVGAVASGDIAGATNAAADFVEEVLAGASGGIIPGQSTGCSRTTLRNIQHADDGAWGAYASILELVVKDPNEMPDIGSIDAGTLVQLNQIAKVTIARIMCGGSKGLSTSEAKYVGAFIYRILEQGGVGDRDHRDQFSSNARTILAKSQNDMLGAIRDIVDDGPRGSGALYFDSATYNRIYPEGVRGGDKCHDREITSKMQRTRLTREIFDFLCETNLPIPINLLLAQPDITVATCANVVAKAGPETGVLVIKDPQVVWIPEAASGMISVTCQFRARLLIMARANLHFVPHTSITRYYGGGGTAFVKYREYQDLLARNKPPGKDHGLFVIPLRGDEEIRDGNICTPGDWHPELIGTNSNPLHYSTAVFARARYNFAHREHFIQAQFYPYDPQGTKEPMLVHPNNELLFRASWYECESKDGKACISRFMPGESPIGHKITPRTARVLHGFNDIFDAELGGESVTTAIEALNH
jgi:hypothetical protein